MDLSQCLSKDGSQQIAIGSSAVALSSTQGVAVSTNRHLGFLFIPDPAGSLRSCPGSNHLFSNFFDSILKALLLNIVQIYAKI